MSLPPAPALAIRPAVAADGAAIVDLVRRLAAFERSPGAVALDEATVRRDCFGAQPRFEVLLADEGGVLRGGAVLLGSYSSWAGKPTLIVHDLYVNSDSRGRGIGRALLAAAAELATARGCCRVDVNVLAWNGEARRFYETLGFRCLDDWLPYRLDGAGMAALAAQADGGGRVAKACRAGNSSPT